MRRHFLSTNVLLVTLFGAFAIAQTVRPPAVPLVTHDPYFSIWSMTDDLSAGPTRHWTGKAQRLTGLIRIDANVFRWMGDAPRGVAALPQTGLTVTPTRTVYQFAGQGVSLEVDFLSPLLPSDLDVMSRPVTYINMTVRSKDAAAHSVQLLFAADASLSVDSGTQEVVWSRSRLRAMTVLRASDFEQPVLQKSGDDLRIDWGYLLLAVPDQAGVSTSTQSSDEVDSQFADGKPLLFDDMDMPRRADPRTVLASTFDLGQVSNASSSCHVLLAYDDIFSIEYLNQWMRPYWRRNGMTMGQSISKEMKSALHDPLCSKSSVRAKRKHRRNRFHSTPASLRPSNCGVITQKYSSAEDWVFANPATRGRKPYWGQCLMRTIIRPAAAKIGITERIGWHTFRHYAECGITGTPSAL